MSINDPQIFNVIDPWPGKDLEKIPSCFERALALYARNKKHMGDGGHHNIYGAIFMLAGLEYHYRNFEHISSQIEYFDIENTEKKDIERIYNTPGRPEKFRSLKHEIIAYLNRVGQFQQFYKSSFAKDAVNGVEKPTISKATKFRHHYSAHRSIDGNSSKGETDYYLAMGFESAYLHDKDNNLMVQYQDQNGKYLNFNLHLDHPKIAEEAYKIIKAVIEEMTHQTGV
jgi:hypothetical protein